MSLSGSSFIAVLRIGIGEAIRHALSFQGIGTHGEQIERTRAMLERVGLKPWNTFYHRYPTPVERRTKATCCHCQSISIEPQIGGCR